MSVAPAAEYTPSAAYRSSTPGGSAQGPSLRLTVALKGEEVYLNRAKRRRFSAAASASARCSKNIEAAGPPDPTIGSGRCSPERGCHEVTGVEKSEIPFDRTFGTCAEIKSPFPEGRDLGMG